MNNTEMSTEEVKEKTEGIGEKSIEGISEKSIEGIGEKTEESSEKTTEEIIREKARNAAVMKRAAFGAFDFLYEESWLNDMAAKGFLLKKVSMWKYHFYRTTSTTLRYRVLPKNINDISIEENELYSIAGWHPACAYNDRTFLVTNDPEAEELFTDAESYRLYLKKTFRKMIMQLLMWLFILVLALYNHFSGSSSFLSLTYKNMASEVVTVLLILVYALFLISGIFRYRRCKRDIMEKTDPADSTEYSGVMKGNVITTALCVFVIVIALIQMSFYNNTKLSLSDALNYEGTHPVMMRELSPDEWGFAEDALKNGSTIMKEGDDAIEVEYNYELTKASNFTLKEGYSEEVYERARSGVSDELPSEEIAVPGYTALYYDFRSEKKAEKMLNEQIESDVNSTTEGGTDKTLEEMIRIDADGADYAGFYDERGGDTDPGRYGTQYLFLRKGSKVVYISYEGEKELLDSIDLFASQLN